MWANKSASATTRVRLGEEPFVIVVSIDFRSPVFFLAVKLLLCLTRRDIKQVQRARACGAK